MLLPKELFSNLFEYRISELAPTHCEAENITAVQTSLAYKSQTEKMFELTISVQAWFK
jgi:hypothetical protein